MAYLDSAKAEASQRVIALMLMLGIVLGSVAPAGSVLAAEATSTPETETTPAAGDVGEDGNNGGDATEGADGEGTDEESANIENGENGENGEHATSTDPAEGQDGTGADEGAPGEEGHEGTDGSATSTASSTGNGIPAVVDTGDAESDVQVVNTGNQNTTDTGSTTGTTTTAVVTENAIAATNTATSAAQTGDNAAADPDGAFVFTGAADAFGLLVSMFNIVITNSQGSLLFLQNPLGPALDLTERITSAFSGHTSTSTPTCTLLGCESTSNAIFNAITDNVADITNSLIVRSGSGNNDAVSQGGDAVVDTGNARAFGSLINFGNLQIVDSRYLVILMNNFGDLEGDIVLPPPDFFRTLSTAAYVDAGSETDIATQNTADITNNGTTSADTGNNTAQAQEDAVIDTGNGTTGVDIHNFVNQTSFGGRPICFIVSAAKGWNGDVVGLPDGFERQETGFGEVICGAGTASASSTHARASSFVASTTNYAKVLNNAIVEAATGGNFASGTDAYIETGDAEAFLSILNLVNQNIIGQDWIFALFTVSGEWNGDLTFGSDEFWHEVNGEVDQYRGGGGGGGVLRRESSALSIEKTVSKPSITASSSVDYTITLKNKGGPVYHALLVDTIYNEGGKAIHEQRWGLDTIQSDETITITYTVFFSGSTTPGTYFNEAFVSGVHRHPNFQKNYGDPINSPIATAELEVTTLAQVLAAYAGEPEVCEAYLTKYLRLGFANDPSEVMKLQKFLAEFEGMDVPVTGIFDAATDLAVKAFQEKYRGDVLTPWGMPVATGFVYYTTQKKVNELYCRGTRIFDLSPFQTAEIEAFKDRFEALPARQEQEEIEDALDEVGGTFDDVEIADAKVDSEDTGMNAIAVPVMTGTQTATTVERAIERVKSSFLDIMRLLSESIYAAKQAFASEEKK